MVIRYFASGDDELELEAEIVSLEPYVGILSCELPSGEYLNVDPDDLISIKNE